MHFYQIIGDVCWCGIGARDVTGLEWVDLRLQWDVQGKGCANVEKSSVAEDGGGDEMWRFLADGVWWQIGLWFNIQGLRGFVNREWGAVRRKSREGIGSCAH